MRDAVETSGNVFEPSTYSHQTTRDMLTNEKFAAIAKNLKRTPITLMGFCGLILCIIIVAKLPRGYKQAGAVGILMFGAAMVPIAVLDIRRRRTLLDYLPDVADKTQFGQLVGAFAGLKMSSASWWILGEKAVRNYKHNGGANSNVMRGRIRFKRKNPWFLRSNVAPLLIPAERNLYLFPDAALLVGRGKLELLTYADFKVTASSIRFVETGFLPKDAMVVGFTWQHVNKDGSPDRRMKENRRFSILRYDVLTIQHPSFGSVTYYCSAQHVASAFRDAFNQFQAFSVREAVNEN